MTRLVLPSDEKRKRNAVSRATLAVVVIIVVAVAAIGAYAAILANGGGATTTVTATSTATQLSTSVTTSITTATINQTTTATITSQSTVGPPATLNGAGSTLVFPLMSSWTFAYGEVVPNVHVNYASVGSGAGIAQITAKTVDFGASDAPMSAAQYAALPGTAVTIPESASSVVPAYNLPGIGNGVKFTGAVLAKIFLGTITQWNDPALVALNSDVNLPSHAITVVHRSDGSGTMFAFTNYLSDASSVWKTKVGKGTSVNWPTGLGCKGNEGVAGCIANTQYSIGPLEIAYEITNKGLISYGSVQNAAGNFILANLTNTAAAVQAGGTTGLPAGNAQWTKVSIIDSIYNDTAATNAYPIATFTYLFVYQQQTDQTKGTALVNFLWWVVNSAQQGGASLGYVPLPPNIVALDDAAINSITFNGKPIHSGP